MAQDSGHIILPRLQAPASQCTVGNSLLVQVGVRSSLSNTRKCVGDFLENEEKGKKQA